MHKKDYGILEENPELLEGFLMESLKERFPEKTPGRIPERFWKIPWRNP